MIGLNLGLAAAAIAAQGSSLPAFSRLSSPRPAVKRANPVKSAKRAKAQAGRRAAHRNRSK